MVKLDKVALSIARKVAEKREQSRFNRTTPGGRIGKPATATPELQALLAAVRGNA